MTNRTSSVSDDDPRWRSPEASHGVDTGFEIGPAARSFAADAHDCIMVRSLWTYRIQGCGAILRARWQAPLGPFCCPTKKITGAQSKSALTENAPYKVCSAFTPVTAYTLALSPYFVTRFPKASATSLPP